MQSTRRTPACHRRPARRSAAVAAVVALATLAGGPGGPGGPGGVEARAGAVERGSTGIVAGQAHPDERPDQHPDEPDAAARRPRGALAPDRGTLFGTWIERGDGSVRDNLAALHRREEQIGRRFDISQHFYRFDKPFPGPYEADDLAHGRIPLVAWNGTDTDAIVNGRHDALIDARARALDALGAPVFIRFFWEPEAKTDRIRTPASYVAAWRHVHARFAAAGATDVAWVWCPTAYGFLTGEAQRYYPGDDVVDWVCADGYNWAPGRSGDRWRDWEWIYRPAHDFALARAKPLMAGEWGVQERDPGEKAAWMDDARRLIPTAFPALAAVVAFDEDRRYDWRVDSTPEALAAFVRWAQDPWFDPTAPPDGDGGDDGGDDGDGPIFADDFRSGLHRWDRRERAVLADEALAIRTRSGGAFATARLGHAAPQVWVQARVRIEALGRHSVRLLTLRAPSGRAIAGVGVRRDGRLLLVDDRSGIRVAGTRTLPVGRWVGVKMRLDAEDGTAAAFVHGRRVARQHATSLRAPGVGAVELGDRGGRGLAKRFSLAFRAVVVDDAPI